MTVKALRKQLAAAIAMTLVATVALGSSTYAWFTMNKEVSVKGMQVKAQAEAGLLINEVKTAGDDYWDESATALVAPGTALVPTSTTNATKWFHANSRIASDEAGASANQASTNLSGYYLGAPSPKEIALTEEMQGFWLNRIRIRLRIRKKKVHFLTFQLQWEYC